MTDTPHTGIPAELRDLFSTADRQMAAMIETLVGPGRCVTCFDTPTRCDACTRKAGLRPGTSTQ